MFAVRQCSTSGKHLNWQEVPISLPPANITEFCRRHVVLKKNNEWVWDWGIWWVITIFVFIIKPHNCKNSSWEFLWFQWSTVFCSWLDCRLDQWKAPEAFCCNEKQHPNRRQNIPIYQRNGSYELGKRGFPPFLTWSMSGKVGRGFGEGWLQFWLQ